MNKSTIFWIILSIVAFYFSGCCTLSEKDHERFEDEFNRYKEDKEYYENF